MDYEKAYKDALAKAREIHRNESEKRFDMEWLFPELKESEDERIRKDLLAFIKAPYVYDYIVHDRVDPWIAWLEKQGEQKPILDFKASNWYVSKVDGKIHDMTYNPTDKVEPFDKYKGLTDFERTLADICIGWIGEEIGWKDYIIKNSLPLLEIAKRQLLQQGELIQPVF